MKKLYFTLFALCGLVSYLSAQYVDNALLFSQQSYGSTARSKAMGNAFGALGGDFGSLSINPAGIGIYQRGEVSTSISMLNQKKTETTYQGNTNSDSNNKFNFNNFGYVSTIPMSGNNSGIVSVNFGLGFNRLANFNQSTYVGTESSPYSRIDAFAQNTNGINYNDLVTSSDYDPYASGIPWESKMAWENYLIDVSNPGTGDDQYKAYFLQSNENVKQIESVHREGFNNEYIASLGANFNHTLYLGATIGMQDLFYDEAKLYSESGITTSSLKSWGKFDYSNNSRITGIGYNLKLGAIYRPIPALRIGIALHTPTYFHFKETYSSIMNSTLTDINTNANGSHSEVTPIGNYEYNFHSPLRAIGSVAYQIAKKAMLSLDYELVDYGSMKYSKGLGGDNFSVENDEIKTIYNAVSNVRIGAEVRLTDAFSVRGGLEYLGNPYKSVINNIPQPNTNFNFKTYNGGIGYRSGKFSIDMTYSVGDKTNYMYLYQIDGVTVDPVKYRAISSELMFTVAMRM